jgi:uncharacterized membrane protein YphA (DoxX/SURF4 family)
VNVVLWVLAGVLAGIFLAAGMVKLLVPRKRLVASAAWVEDFPDGAVKGIGVLEVLAAIGLLLPAAVGIAPVFVPLAATGLVLLMVGAAITHARRHEVPRIAVNGVLLVLASVVAAGRFGPWSF